MKTYKVIDDFLLLLWKNLVLKWRKPQSTIIEIFLPIIACLLLCFMVKTELVKKDGVTYDSYETDNQAPPIAAIMWSPCANPFLKNVMKRVVEKMKIEEECHNNSQVLHQELEFSLGSKIVGVEFEDSLSGKTDVNKNMKISFRFEETAYLEFYYWRTNHIYPSVEMAGPRESDNEFGAAPYYYEDGFLSLQFSIVYELLRGSNKTNLPTISMRRFPFPAWVLNEEIYRRIDSVLLFILLGFMYTFLNSLRSVAAEKESQVKELMKIMGMASWIHWQAWFFSILVISLIPIIIAVILLKRCAFYSGFAPIFPLTDGFVLFVFFVLFVSATVAFAFAVSVFFTRSHTACIVGAILYLAAIFPYLMVKISAFPSALLSCLSWTTAFAQGLKIIAEYESLSEYLTFKTLFSPVSQDASLSMGIVMLMLILDSIIYFIIAIYVEAVYPGKYGLPKVWYFPFTRRFWRGERDIVDLEQINEDEIARDSAHYQKDTANKPAGIKVLKLNKKFGKRKFVLTDLSLNMAEGQITVLLGHKGCGKTTAVSILTGILPPTGGTAVINGYDIRCDMKKIRETLGFCPQHNVLFDNLTVSEHLFFFSKLRGLRKAELKDEIETYVNLLDLTDKKKTKSKNLSVGMKRRLCVGIALCGKSKICIFDEPTLGMDPNGMKMLWDLIKTQKTGRTILVSTRYVNEADALGDRVAVLANGTLQCYGSTSFLKRHYGSGYRLVIAKNREAETDRITKMLRGYIATIELESNLPREVIYILPDNETRLFESMLGELERHFINLGVTSYRISLATMEEAFMKVGVEYDTSITEEYGTSVSQYVLSSGKFSQEAHVDGFILYRNQIFAMVMKKAITTFRSWLLLLIHVLLPVFFTFLLMNYLKMMEEMRSSPALLFTLDSYQRPISVIATDNTSNIYYQSYKKILSEENRDYSDWGTEGIIPNIIKKSEENIRAIRKHYVIGATFLKNDTIESWFNNEPYHSPPLALQYVLNSVIKVQMGADYSIQFTNKPSFHTVHTEDEMGEFLHAIVYTLVIGVCMCYVASYYVVFYVKERVCTSKHLQLVSGTAISAFWFVAFIWDFAIFMLMTVCIIVVLLCFQACLDTVSLLLLFVLFGFAMLPMVYLLAFFFKRTSSAYSAVNLICFVIGPIAFILICFVWPVFRPPNKFEVMHDLFLAMPHYSLVSGVYNLSGVCFATKSCSFTNTLHKNLTNTSDTTKYQDYACFTFPERCCDIRSTSSRNGIGRHLIYLLVVGLVLFLMLFIYEHRLLGSIFYKFLTFFNRTPRTEGTHDQDVLDEKYKVRNDHINHRVYEVVLRDVTKYYRSKLAVNQLCVGLKGFECFGLIGVEGGGKSTMFRMITGEVRMSHGNAWICGYSIIHNLKKVHRCVGYCPQSDALLDDLTGKETLIMYCLIRGISVGECSITARRLAKEFRFFRFFNEKVKHYSGGNKRKLSTAIALIGEPPILLLDEPSIGMDPATRTYLWNALCRIRDNGKCLILATSNMDECEAICTRLAIMVNGAFQCLGSPQYLKDVFKDDIALVVKMRTTPETQSIFNAMLEIDEFVYQNFPKSEKTRGQETVRIYMLREVNMPWSKLFGTMERGKKTIKVIEDYTLSQFTLEQIFFLFTQMQLHQG